MEKLDIKSKNILFDLDNLTKTDIEDSKTIKIVGQGSYGIVYEMESKKGERFALKVTGDDDESLTINMLILNGINCNRIGAKEIYITTDEKDIENFIKDKYRFYIKHEDADKDIREIVRGMLKEISIIKKKLAKLANEGLEADKYLKKDLEKDLENQVDLKDQILDDLKYIDKLYKIAYVLADGDLNKLIPTLDIQARLDILIKIAEMVKCLQEKGLYYLDLKFGNILYFEKSNGDIAVYFGDLGSIKKQNQSGSCTYPPFIPIDPNKSEKENNERYNEAKGDTSTLVWQLNILLIKMFVTKDNKDVYVWSNLLVSRATAVEHIIALIDTVYNITNSAGDKVTYSIENIMLNYKTITLDYFIKTIKLIKKYLILNKRNVL